MCTMLSTSQWYINGVYIVLCGTGRNLPHSSNKLTEVFFWISERQKQNHYLLKIFAVTTGKMINIKPS